MRSQLSTDGVFGDFCLDGLLGRGVLGEVWRATHESGDDVVLRIFRPEFVQRKFEKQLREQLRQVQEFAHPNIVYVRAVHHIDGHLVQEMERVHGLSVRELARRNPLTWMAVLNILRPVATGLAAAHETGLSHGHLSQDKVLVRFDGRVVLSDIGLQKAFSFMAQQADLDEILFGEGTASTNYRLAEGDAVAFGRLAWELLSSGREFGPPSHVDYRRLGLDLPDRFIEVLVGASSPNPPRISAVRDTLEEIGKPWFPDPVDANAEWMQFILSEEGRRDFKSKLHTTRPSPAEKDHLITLARSEADGADPFEASTPHVEVRTDPSTTQPLPTPDAAQTQADDPPTEVDEQAPPPRFQELAKTVPETWRPSSVRVERADAEKTQTHAPTESSTRKTAKVDVRRGAQPRLSHERRVHARRLQPVDVGLLVVIGLLTATILYLAAAKFL